MGGGGGDLGGGLHAPKGKRWFITIAHGLLRLVPVATDCWLEVPFGGVGLRPGTRGQGCSSQRRPHTSGQTGGWRRLPKRLGAVTVGYKCR